MPKKPVVVTKIKTKHFTALFIDIAFLALLIGIVIFEYNNFNSISFLLDLVDIANNMNEKFLMVTALLPLAITVISIVISFPKNDVYGIPLNRIYPVTKPGYYSLLHIFVVSVCLFAASLVLQIMKKPVSNIVVEVIALIYSFVFGLQQLRLFLNSRGVVLRLLKYQYKHNGLPIIEDLNKNSERNLYRKMIRNFILIDGMECLFNKLNKYIARKGNNYDETVSKLLGFFLILQSEFLNDIDDALENKYSLENGYYDNLRIIDSMYTSYLNIKWLVESTKVPLLETKDALLIDESIRLLHRLMQILGISDDEKEYLENIFYKIFNENNFDKNVQEILLSSTLNTLKNDEIWFVKSLINTFSLKMFSKEQNKYYDFSWFLIMMIAYIINSSDRPEQTNVYTLVESRSRSMRLTFYAVKFRFFITELSFRELVGIYGRVIKLFDSEAVKKFNLKERMNNNSVFNESILFRYWFEILHYNPENSREVIKEMFYSLEDKQKKSFAEEVFYNIKENGETTFNYEFFKIFHAGARKTLKVNSLLYIGKILFDITMEYLINQEVLELSKSKINNITIKKDLLDRLNNDFQNTPFKNKKIKIKKKESKFEILVDDFHTKLELRFKCNRYFIKIIANEIKGMMDSIKILRVEKGDGYLYNDRIMKQIDEMKIKYATSINKLQENKNSIEPIDIPFLASYDFLCAENAIKFWAVIDDSSITVTKAKPSEIKKYITNSSTNKDGFYTLRSSILFDDININEKKYIEILKQNLYTVDLKIKYGIEIDPEKCLLITKNALIR